MSLQRRAQFTTNIELLHKEHTFEIMCSGIKADRNPVSWPGLTCWIITRVRVRRVYADLHHHRKQQAYCIFRHAIGGFNDSAGTCF